MITKNQAAACALVSKNKAWLTTAFTISAVNGLLMRNAGSGLSPAPALAHAPSTTTEPHLPAPPTHHPPPAHEAKFTALDLKAIAPNGAFEGYASLFNKEDLGHDIMLPGAFRETLASRGPAGVKMLFQHNPSEPIGVWDVLREDAKGLFVQGRLLLDVVRGREVYALMRAGAINGLSIGYRAVRARRDRPRAPRKLIQIDLWEISIVTFPMLPEARVAAIKQRPFAGRRPSARDFERWLTEDAGLTRSQAQAVIRHGLKGLALAEAAAGNAHVAPDIAARLSSLAASIRSATPTT